MQQDCRNLKKIILVAPAHYFDTALLLSKLWPFLVLLPAFPLKLNFGGNFDEIGRSEASFNNKEASEICSSQNWICSIHHQQQHQTFNQNDCCCIIKFVILSRMDLLGDWSRRQSRRASLQRVYHNSRWRCQVGPLVQKRVKQAYLYVSHTNKPLL